jgi:hypothetical protein
LPFTPADAHINAALVLTGSFGQFADPLDWLAKQFGLDAKVDRAKLSESLAARGGSGKPVAEARSTNGKIQFHMELYGRCEGKLIAMCGCSYSPRFLSLKQVEEICIDMTVLTGGNVLGIQASPGRADTIMDGIENEEPLVRMLTLNVFHRVYFQSKINLIEKDRKLRIADVGDAVLVQLAKPWLFYDVPRSARSRKAPQRLLPF